MNTNIITKGGLRPTPTMRFIISTSDIIRYLESQLGCWIGYDFTRWTGVTVDHSYVRMRAVFNPDEIVAKTSTNDYVDRVLAENAAGMKFKDTIMDAMKPFMYPDLTGANINSDIETIKRLLEIGLYEDRIKDIIEHSKLNYCRDANLFGIYLCPEKIIADMLKNPATDEIDGEMIITNVHGTSSDTIRWEAIIINKKKMSGSTSIDMNKIFNTK